MSNIQESTATEASTSRLSIISTRPENLGPSNKRVRGPSVYSNLLPLVPAGPGFINSLLSAMPHLSLSPPQIQVLYDDLTKTVWVTGEQDMILLWRRGFFGKGTLSRSEPSWKRRVENKIAESQGRAKNLTSEEITAIRRAERKASKQVKKLEREAEKLLAASAAAAASAESERGSSIGSPRLDSSEGLALASESMESIREEEEQEQEREDAVPEETRAETREPDEDHQAEPPRLEDPPPLWHLEAEHMQLQPEEAFFLLFAVGVLSLRWSSPFASDDENKSPLSILSTWQLFLRDGAVMRTPLPRQLDVPDDPRLTRFDSPFLISYASYHHYRSMGWVVRSGVKFCCEWVLYGQGGPVGGHAEFAVVVIPNYTDPADAETSPFRSATAGELVAEGEKKNTWRWFNTVNRVCSGVKKTLVLLHVKVPPMSSLPHPRFIAENPAQALAMFEMREVTVRRFLAGRSRD